MDAELVLGTLADNTLLSGVVGENTDQDMFLMSIDGIWALGAHTAGEGPITVGLAHEDYTDAEIQQFLDNTGSWSPGDLIDQEIAKRKIRIVGVFPGADTDEVLNDGKPIRTKCMWRNATGQSLKNWAFNKSGAPLTTGSVILLTGNAYLNQV